MLSPLDFIGDLMNPQLAFLPKALAMAVLSAIVCGLVGAHVVLRGMSFMGDAISHAVFPGLAFAFLLQGSLVLGGLIAGITTAILIAIVSQHRKVGEDSAIGVLFVSMFALGIVVISFAPGYSGSLQSFLFGSITGIPDEDVITALIMSVVIVGILALFHRGFVAIALDRESAQASGIRVFPLDIVLSVLIAVAVVVSVQTIGNILVLALLIIPPATARLLTDKLTRMMWLSPIIGAISAVIGLYLSWAIDLPTGGTIVLVSTAFFVVAWLVGALGTRKTAMAAAA